MPWPISPAPSTPTFLICCAMRPPPRFLALALRLHPGASLVASESLLGTVLGTEPGETLLVTPARRLHGQPTPLCRRWLPGRLPTTNVCDSAGAPHPAGAAAVASLANHPGGPARHRASPRDLRQGASD